MIAKEAIEKEAADKQEVDRQSRFLADAQAKLNEDLSRDVNEENRKNGAREYTLVPDDQPGSRRETKAEGSAASILQEAEELPTKKLVPVAKTTKEPVPVVKTTKELVPVVKTTKESVPVVKTTKAKGSCSE